MIFKMNKIWFTSDSHFGHDRIIKYANRPFESVGEMDIALIQAWNERVGDDDTVYHLGDFCFGKKKEFVKYASRLNGRIMLIRGNHDHWMSQRDIDKKIVCYQDEPVLTKSGHFIMVLPLIVDLKPVDLGRKDDTWIVLAHYPLVSWNRSCHGSLHLYGHMHGLHLLSAKSGKSMDVGVDATDDYAPMSTNVILSNLT